MHYALLVGVHAAEQEVDTEVGEEYRKESGYHIDVEECRSSEECDAARVQGEGIDEHGYQRPYFFRVPSPVSSPAYVSPYGSYKDAYREAENSRVEHE